MIEVSRLQARRALLAAQGLVEAPPPEPGPADVLDAIGRMHALQIDTISVVARSPYLVLWSRLGDYDAALLDTLLAQGAIFEHISHAACFLLVEDYPLYRRMMIERQDGANPWHRTWVAENGALVEAVLQRVRDEGALRSADFERTDGRKSGGWWDWKGEKVALETLFLQGELMVAGRRNFQRIYDLRERVLPEWDDSLAPTFEAARRALVLKAVRALGIAQPRWVKVYLQDVRVISAAMVSRELSALAQEGDLLPVAVEGLTGKSYVHRDDLSLLETRIESAPRTSFLSPFDPVVWDRRRALDLFGFDYRIECYTPAPMRSYGYFTLPILHGDDLVGRLDAKAHRRDGLFEVKALHLEPDVEATDTLIDGLAGTLQRIAAWHKTPEVGVRRTEPASLADALTKAL